MSETRKIGLIGLGDVSAHHVAAINNVGGLELIAVSDVDETRNPNLSGVRFYNDYREMFGQKNMDTVVIATPHMLHTPMTLEALARGYDVMVEKPVATKVEDAQDMIQTANANGKMLIVSSHFRFSPEVQQYLRTSYEYGTIKGFEAHFSGWPDTNRQWLMQKRHAGGVWMDNGINVISVLSMFLPDLRADTAEFEYSTTGVPDRDVENHAKVNLTSNRAQGIVTVDWRSNDFNYCTMFDTAGGKIVLDHRFNEISRNGKLIYKDEDKSLIAVKRYKGVYGDFKQRMGQRRSNAGEALRDLQIVVDAYARGERK